MNKTSTKPTAYQTYCQMVDQIGEILGLMIRPRDESWTRGFHMPGGHRDVVTVSVRFDGVGSAKNGRKASFKVELNWSAIGAQPPATAMVFAAMLQEAALMAAKLELLAQSYRPPAELDMDAFYAEMGEDIAAQKSA